MPLAAAGIAAAGTIGGALISSSAAKSAAEKQMQMQQQGLDFQKGLYQDNVGRQMPFYNVGKDAAGTLSDIYGFNGTGGPGSGVNWDAYMNTPDYQFTLQQGQRALDMSAASKHLLNSGGMVRAAQSFGQGLAGQQFGATIQRLMGMMNMGQTSAQNMLQGGQGVANQFNMMGQTAAAGTMGAANPWVSALNTGPGNALGAYKYFGGTLGGAQTAAPAAAGAVGNPLALAGSSYLPSNALSATGGLW